MLGHRRTPGAKLYTLAGDVARPGLFDAPRGITLRQMRGVIVVYWFNRVAAVSLSCVGLVLLARGLASRESRQGMELGLGLLFAILAGTLIVLLWRGLFHRRRRPEAQAVALQAAVAGDSPDAIRCQFLAALGNRPAAIVVDRSQNSIRFAGCFQPRRLLTMRREDYQCPLDDIVAVYDCPGRGCRVLKIVTVNGTALVADQSAVGFAELQAALSGFSRPNRPGYALENPRLSGLLGLALFCGAVAGVLAVQGLVPRAASTGTVALAMLGGGFCGLVGLYWLIHAVYRWWSRRSRR